MTSKERLELYRNYLYALICHQEYGDKYGDTKELIEMYEKKLELKNERKNKISISNINRQKHNNI